MFLAPQSFTAVKLFLASCWEFVPFALTVCNNSYVFALKTSNVNASFKYKMYLGLAKWELMVPGTVIV